MDDVREEAIAAPFSILQRRKLPARRRVPKVLLVEVAEGQQVVLAVATYDPLAAALLAQILAHHDNRRLEDLRGPLIPVVETMGELQIQKYEVLVLFALAHHLFVGRLPIVVLDVDVCPEPRQCSVHILALIPHSQMRGGAAIRGALRVQIKFVLGGQVFQSRAPTFASQRLHQVVRVPARCLCPHLQSIDAERIHDLIYPGRGTVVTV
mmetsp:Transcript_126338/g.404468  ORF Transcript_126338/g.404468 Transcript_126338/m.404468 type:complete len:209 (+) Transcript_126338:275-901(+)